LTSGDVNIWLAGWLAGCLTKAVVLNCRLTIAKKRKKRLICDSNAIDRFEWNWLFVLQLTHRSHAIRLDQSVIDEIDWRTVSFLFITPFVSVSGQSQQTLIPTHRQQHISRVF
jgi:hypothetical protein